MKHSNIFKAFLFAVFIMIPYSVVGQFPRRCTDTDALNFRECCPRSKDGSKCGEVSGRGFCNNILSHLSTSQLNESLRWLLDDRAWWPRAFYDRACVCAGNYDGVDCSQCKIGYEGDVCEIKSTLKVRRNITKLTNKEMKRFIDVLDESKKRNSENYVILTTSFDKVLQGEEPMFANASIYNVFVWMNYYAARSNLVFPSSILNNYTNNYSITNQNERMRIAKNLLQWKSKLEINRNVDYAHEGSSFPTWHRYFLLLWERELGQEIAEDPSFALPYWDWRDQTTCDVCKNKLFGAQNPQNKKYLSVNSPFFKWDTICTKLDDDYLNNGLQCTGVPEGLIARNPNIRNPQLPTAKEINALLQNKTIFDTANYNKKSNGSFRNVLEGFANPNTAKADGKLYMNNAVLKWLSGSISHVKSSVNDPIFFAHFSFLDGLFEMWLQEHRNSYSDDYIKDSNSTTVGHRMQDYMVPFFPLVQNRDGFASTTDLGYVYDFADQGIEAFEKHNECKKIEKQYEELQKQSKHTITILAVVVACLGVVFLLFVGCCTFKCACCCKCSSRGGYSSI